MEPPVEKEQIEELQSQVEALTDKWKRALADYHNLERRTNEARQLTTQLANRHLWLKILPVLDNLELAVKAQSENEGLAAIARQFRQVLEGENVREIEALGRSFDPHFHECVDVAAGETDNKVVEVLRAGYTIGETVLRPARVRVSKKAVSAEGAVEPPVG